MSVSLLKSVLNKSAELKTKLNTAVDVKPAKRNSNKHSLNKSVGREIHWSIMFLSTISI